MNINYTLRRPLSAQQKELAEKMTAEISKPEIKTVSFKAENVLLVLPFAEESSFFALMEDAFRGMPKKDISFADYRTEAQDEAEKKLALRSPVKLENVYDILMKISGISAEQRDTLMKLECELYLKYACPRECGRVLFEKAAEGKKKIIVTSTGLYSRELMKKALEHCGYEGYNILIVQNELDIPAAAESGYLDIVLKKAKGKASSVLHIGGDVKSDVEAPILKGAKALLMQSQIPLMITSGRFRGYVQAEYLHDYDTEGFFALRCVLGLYCCYGFGWQQKKVFHSDFCGDYYMLGFVVLGALSLAEDFRPTAMQSVIVSALKSSPEAADGLADFETMYNAHFGGLKENIGREGCELPLVFLEKYAYNGDKELLKAYMSEEDFAAWTNNSKEPELAPVYAHKAKKNAAARLADRLFPPNTRVRTIADGILAKAKGKRQ